MVRGGRVREADKIGNDMADEAADFGRRGVGADVVDARRNYSSACWAWSPVFQDLHRFFMQWLELLSMAMAKVALHPSLWFGLLVAGRSVGELSKR